MRWIGLFLSVLVLFACASVPTVRERDRFPLDPREGLAGPFPDGVEAGWDALLSADVERAEKTFRGALEKGGGLAARIGLIESWVIGGDAKQAVAACAEALRTGEGTAPLLVACGEARAALSEPVEALELYEKALGRAPGREGLRSRAEELRKTAREGLVAAATGAMEKENWELAREQAERAIAVDPKNPELRALAADIERGAGNMEKALARYREALELGYSGPDVQAKLAEMALETGDHALAVALFDELTRRDPRFADRAAEARMAFRVTNWPQPEREAAQNDRLTRAEAAILVWWMMPEVREVRVSSGVIASDAVSRRDSRAVTRALALGFLDVDPVTHRANPDAPLTSTAAAKMLLRLLMMLRPDGGAPACLNGAGGPPRSGVESLRLVTACGLLPQTEATTLSGADFLRALDRIRSMVGSRENARRE
jgi:tetratricopeptide (TPR) repeat protein